jgi:SAM-dependent methyltransferase
VFDFIRKPLLWQAWDEGLDHEIGRLPEFQLKSMQDLAVYSRLRDLREQTIAEIGAGHSRVLPALAKHNTCVAVEKFEGKGGGPTRRRRLPDVRTVSAYLGEDSAELADDSFDVVFSISVVEHVRGPEELAAFHADQLRVLKPGGMFLHAIDLYLENRPRPRHRRRFGIYRDWVASTPNVEPVGEVYDGPCRFTADLATNPDNVMHMWGQVSSKLTDLRQRAQCVSLLVAGRKLGGRG